MAIRKIKRKSTSKVKSASKTKAKLKAKPKAKSKTKPRAKLKAKPKAKSKTKPKTKSKAKPKTRFKAKSKSKPQTAKKQTTRSKVKVKAKAKSKPTSAKKSKSKKVSVKFNLIQKNELLLLIEKIVNLHKGIPGGLKTFTGIDQILNKYNQHYTDVNDKFDAIVDFGMEKDPRKIEDHFYVNVQGREKDVNALYELLARMAKGKVNFPNAREEIETIYAKDLEIYS